MKRGDVVLVAPAGEFGKPRPAIVIQNCSAPPSEYVTFIPVTSDLLRVPGVRVSISPSLRNGLRKPSEAMVDLIQTAKSVRFGGVIGSVEPETILLIESALILHLGLV